MPVDYTDYQSSINALKNKVQTFSPSEPLYVSKITALTDELVRFDDPAFKRLPDDQQTALKASADICATLLTRTAQWTDKKTQALNQLESIIQTLAGSAEPQVQQTGWTAGGVLAAMIAIPLLPILLPFTIYKYAKQKEPAVVETSSRTSRPPNIEETKNALQEIKEELTKFREVSLTLEPEQDPDALKTLHASQGSLNSTPIHLATPNAEMHDQDITRIMPKSFGNTEVLAPLNLNDEGSKDAIREGITAAINDQKIRHILIPVGPGHWRGLSLSKPDNTTELYKLEIYDSFGNDNAKLIEDQVLQLLQECGVENVEIVYTQLESNQIQTDTYSCGDYVCGFFHQKMKKFNLVNETAYNQTLVTAFEEGEPLRETTRAVSKENYVKPSSPQPSAFPETKEAFHSKFMELSKDSDIHNGSEFKVIDHANGYVLQSHLMNEGHQRDRDVTVSNEKVSAVLTAKTDEKYMANLAKIMVYAAMTAGHDLKHLQINSGNNMAMKTALEEEIRRQRELLEKRDSTPPSPA